MNQPKPIPSVFHIDPTQLANYGLWCQLGVVISYEEGHVIATRNGALLAGVPASPRAVHIKRDHTAPDTYVSQMERLDRNLLFWYFGYRWEYVMPPPTLGIMDGHLFNLPGLHAAPLTHIIDTHASNLL